MKKEKIAQNNLFGLAILVMAMGVILRLAAYFFTRSLWVDEANLAMNILDRSFLSFFQPLDLNQSAPVGFLFLEKAATLVFGIGERALRLFPLLAGIGVLPMMYLVSKKIGGWAMVLTSLSLAAFTKYMIYYSNEVKQYSLDVFVTLLLFYLAIRVLDGEGDARKKSLRAYIAGGILAVWFSNGALFVFAGLSFSLAVVFITRRELGDLRHLLLGGLLWLVSVAAVYFAFLRFAQANNYLFQFWEESFAPFPPWSNWNWYWTLLEKVALNPLGLISDWIFYGLLLVGVLYLAVKKRETLLLILLPIVVVLIASMLHLYPFHRRLILFLVPLFFLLMGFGLEGIYELAAKLNKKIAFVIVICLAILFLKPPVENALLETVAQANNENMRPLMATLKNEAKEKDIFYIYYAAKQPYIYYARLLGLDFTNVFHGTNFRESPDKYAEELGKYKGTNRFWYVSSHSYKDEEQLIENALCDLGVLKKRVINSDDTRLYLFDLSRAPAPNCGE